MFPFRHRELLLISDWQLSPSKFPGHSHSSAFLSVIFPFVLSVFFFVLFHVVLFFVFSVFCRFLLPFCFFPFFSFASVFFHVFPCFVPAHFHKKKGRPRSGDPFCF